MMSIAVLFFIATVLPFTISIVVTIPIVFPGG